jgi:hypothetical protein
LFQRLMDRLRNIVPTQSDFGPVLPDLCTGFELRGED